jgi:hypothetical protein
MGYEGEAMPSHVYGSYRSGSHVNFVLKINTLKEHFSSLPFPRYGVFALMEMENTLHQFQMTDQSTFTVVHCEMLKN